MESIEIDGYYDVGTREFSVVPRTLGSPSLFSSVKQQRDKVVTEMKRHCRKKELTAAAATVRSP